MNASDAIAQIPTWRHRIEVSPGVTTPGTEDTAAELPRLGIPEDLAGRRVLDIGCSDGFYSFVCENRGAQVTSIDDESSLLAGGVNGFTVASRLLGSRARYQVMDVHRLGGAGLGHFDVVLFINVLYHLKNPLLALEQIAEVTEPGGLLVLKTYFRQDVRVLVRGRPYGFDIDRRPKWWFFPDRELGGDPTNWFGPNRRAIEGSLRATGWEDVELKCRHGDRLYYHATRSG